MAPKAPVGRAAAMKLVAARRLPVSLGSPHPCAMILEQDGEFRIRALVIDDARARAAGAAAFATGGVWTPEQHYGLGEPVGEIYAAARSITELLEEMESMRWPAHW